MLGAQVTNGNNIPFAQPSDFVVNTRFLGGMKISEKKIFTQNDATTINNTDFWYQVVYPHSLGYVPAVICFQGGVQGIGWQNSALIFQPSVSADNKNIYMLASTGGAPVYVIIFQEKVADQ